MRISDCTVGRIDLALNVHVEAYFTADTTVLLYDRYDLIFIDLDSTDASGVTGFAASNTIRQQGLNTDTPIVGWSSCAEVGDGACIS